MDNVMEAGPYVEEQNWSGLMGGFSANESMYGFQEIASADTSAFPHPISDPFSSSYQPFADSLQVQLPPNASKTLTSSNAYNWANQHERRFSPEIPPPDQRPSQLNETFSAGDLNQNVVLNLFNLSSDTRTVPLLSNDGDFLIPPPPIDAVSSASTPRPVMMQRRKRVTPDDWAEQRPRIKSLYIDQDLSLADTMKHMADTYGFRASVKVYKTKLKDWGTEFEKNIRREHANFMFWKGRKRMAEDGKPTVFKIDGVQVPPAKIQRLLKSNRQNMGSTTGTTPAGMDYATMSEPPTPRALRQDSVVREDGGLESLRLRWNGLDAEALNALEACGLKLIDEEKFDEAGNAFRDALAGFDHLVGPAGDGTVRLLKQLGNLYIKQENLDNAEALYTKSINDHRVLFGEIHYRTLLSLQRLGEYYCSVDRKHDCAIIYNRIILNFETLGETARIEASDVALYVTLHLVEYYHDEEKYEQGLNLLLRALSIYETLGDYNSCILLKKEVLLLYRPKVQSSERAERIILEILDLYEKEKSYVFLNVLALTTRWYFIRSHREKLDIFVVRIARVINETWEKERELSEKTKLQLWQLEQVLTRHYRRLKDLQMSAWWHSHLRESVEAERGVHSEEAIWALMFGGVLRAKADCWEDAELQFKEALRRADIVFGPDSPVKAQISKCLEKDPESCRLRNWAFQKLPSGRGKMLGDVCDRLSDHRSF